MDAHFIGRLKQGGVVLSRVQPSTGWSEIGSAQQDFGFGEDAGSTFRDLFIRAMLAVELRPVANPKVEPINTNSIQASWLATVNGLIASAPPDVYRRERGIVRLGAEPLKDHEYLDKSVPLYRYLFAEFVNPFVELLVPQRTPSVYSLDHLTKEHPFVTPSGAAHTQPGWRYQVMARLLWYNLGPNLRTVEMANPNEVWRQLNRYFWQVHNLHGHWDLMRPATRRRERASFVLAVYHQTLCLLREQWVDAERYRSTISRRASRGGEHLDVTLFIPSGNGNRATLEEARRVRALAFNELLLATLSNCWASLNNLV